MVDVDHDVLHAVPLQPVHRALQHRAAGDGDQRLRHFPILWPDARPISLPDTGTTEETTEEPDTDSTPAKAKKATVKEA